MFGELKERENSVGLKTERLSYFGIVATNYLNVLLINDSEGGSKYFLAYRVECRLNTFLMLSFIKLYIN